jgi:hypothetical protein
MWDCGTPISPGEKYVMTSLTPNDADIGNITWWHGAVHGRSRYCCPDMARQHEALITRGAAQCEHQRQAAKDDGMELGE